MFAGAAWFAAAVFGRAARRAGEAGFASSNIPFKRSLGGWTVGSPTDPASNGHAAGDWWPNGRPRFHYVRMPTFELQFPASEIEALASRFGYPDDARLLETGATARARGHYTREEFIAVCAWKTARSRSKVATNTEGAVVEATRQAIAAADEATRMNALLELEGVGVPTASTLLYFAFPDDYPILDVRALESLGLVNSGGFFELEPGALLPEVDRSGSRHNTATTGPEAAAVARSRRRFLHGRPKLVVQ
jgi:hypothetical protein